MGETHGARRRYRLIRCQFLKPDMSNELYYWSYHSAVSSCARLAYAGKTWPRRRRRELQRLMRGPSGHADRYGPPMLIDKKADSPLPKPAIILSGETLDSCPATAACAPLP